ncbi:MAG: hypothetical protein NT169_16670 [Chloroflexi bacterium]|nr:hypothetical protein [Chloroflexota bacterium]
MHSQLDLQFALIPAGEFVAGSNRADRLAGWPATTSGLNTG